MIPTHQNIGALIDYQQFTDEDMAGMIDALAHRVGPWELAEKVMFDCMLERAGFYLCDVETKEMFFRVWEESFIKKHGTVH